MNRIEFWSHFQSLVFEINDSFGFVAEAHPASQKAFSKLKGSFSEKMSETIDTKTIELAKS